MHVIDSSMTKCQFFFNHIPMKASNNHYVRVWLDHMGKPYIFDGSILGPIYQKSPCFGA